MHREINVTQSNLARHRGYLRNLVSDNDYAAQGAMCRRTLEAVG